MGLIELPIGVGRTNDPVTAPRNDEEQAFLGAGDQSCHGVDAVPGHHEMDTFGCADSELSTTAQHLLQLVDPDSCGIDRLLRSDGELPAGLKITNDDAGDPICLAQKADHTRARGDRGAVVGCGTTDHHRVPGVVNLAFVELDRADHRLPIRRGEGLERALAAQVTHVVRDPASGAEYVVHADAEAAIAAVDHRPHERVQKRHRLDQMRGQLVEGQRALLESLEDQGKIEVFQIAEPPVKQLAGPTRGTSAEITGLDQPDPQAAGDGIERAAAARDAGSNDENVQILMLQPVEGICSGGGTE
jgi:hypothetical protein